MPDSPKRQVDTALHARRQIQLLNDTRSEGPTNRYTALLPCFIRLLFQESEQMLKRCLMASFEILSPKAACPRPYPPSFYCVSRHSTVTRNGPRRCAFILSIHFHVSSIDCCVTTRLGWLFNLILQCLETHRSWLNPSWLLQITQCLHSRWLFSRESHRLARRKYCPECHQFYTQVCTWLSFLLTLIT